MNTFRKLALSTSALVLMTGSAFGAAASYQPVASLSALAALGAASPGVLHADVLNIGKYDWYSAALPSAYAPQNAACPGVIDGSNYVSATGVATTSCWVAQSVILTHLGTNALASVPPGAGVLPPANGGSSFAPQATIATLTGSDQTAFHIVDGKHGVVISGYYAANDWGIPVTFYAATSCMNNLVTCFHDSAGNAFQRSIVGLTFLHGGAKNDGVFDNTAAWNNFLTVTHSVDLPCGTYAGNFVYANSTPASANGLTIDGHKCSVLYQYNKNATLLDIYGTSATNQIVGILIKDVALVGHSTTGTKDGTAPCLRVGGTSSIGVSNSVFDHISAANCWKSLVVDNDGGTGLHYNNSYIHFVSEGTISDSVVTSGPYNKYELFITTSPSGIALRSTDQDGTFHAVTDGQLYLTGFSNKFYGTVVEGISAASGSEPCSAIYDGGANNSFYGITLIGIANTKLTCGAGITFGGGVSFSIQDYNVVGSYPGGAPIYPMYFSGGNTGVIINAKMTSGMTLLENVPGQTSDAIDKVQFLGDCSTLTLTHCPAHAIPTAFTPHLFYGSTEVPVYDTQLGTCSQLNGIATCSIDIGMSTAGAAYGTTPITITGLPYTNARRYVVGSAYSAGCTYTGDLAAVLAPGSTTIGLNLKVNGTLSTALPSNACTTNSSIGFWISYFTQ